MAKARPTCTSPCSTELEGDYASALGHARQALRLFQAVGHKAGEADALNAVGWCHGLLGDYAEARAFCRQALSVNAEVGYRRLEGYIWYSLGYAEHQLGNVAELSWRATGALPASPGKLATAGSKPASSTTQAMRGTPLASFGRPGTCGSRRWLSSRTCSIPTPTRSAPSSTAWANRACEHGS